ncbi:MAG TPA: hypothetical protein VIW29_21530 [Polyangiaceae bacterium]
MTRSFAWVLNLDAELELARGRPGYVPRRKLLAQLAEHGASSRQLLTPGDLLLEPGVIAPQGAVGRAWCPTPRAIAQLHAAGAAPEPHPEQGTLRRVNHRAFAHELGGGLPGQAYVTSRAQLERQLGDYARRWLLKRPLEFAGRGQLRVLGPLSDKQWSWVDVSLARDGLLLEPLVSIALEVSLHGYVWPDRHWELGRICVQQVSERGAFRAVRLAESGELRPEERRAFEERGAAVAAALGSAGYFGPFGIDGHRYQLEGSGGFCALGELNARYTLGFVTGFPRHPSQLRLA